MDFEMVECSVLSENASIFDYLQSVWQAEWEEGIERWHLYIQLFFHLCKISKLYNGIL